MVKLRYENELKVGMSMKELLERIERRMIIEDVKETLEWKEKMLKNIQYQSQSHHTKFRLISYPNSFYKIGSYNLLKNFIDCDSKEIEAIKKMKMENKKWLIDTIKEEMNSWEISSIPLQSSLFNMHVVDKSKRLEYVTEKTNVNQYHFIDEEEKKEIIDLVFKMVILELEIELGIKRDSFEEEFFKAYTTLCDSVYIRELKIYDKISEFELKSYEEAYDFAKIKETLRNWHQNRKNRPMLIDVKNDQIEKVKNYWYLFSDDEKQQIKQNFTDYFSDKLMRIEKGFGDPWLTNTEILENMKGKILELEELYGDDFL
jgi:hypothetical protein